MFENETQHPPHILAMRITAILIVILGLFVVPNPKADAAVNAAGVHIGGRIGTFVPSYVWMNPVTLIPTATYCPAHVFIAVTTPASQVGSVGIILPPALPRLSYNYYTPGLQYVGAYYPGFAINYLPGFGCPEAVPIYFGSWFGTGAVPR